MAHVRAARCHPQTQGKIERWRQTLKNRILLENYYLPGDLESQIAHFVGAEGLVSSRSPAARRVSVVPEPVLIVDGRPCPAHTGTHRWHGGSHVRS